MLGPANSSSISVHEVHKNFIVADTPAKITSPRQSCSAGWTSTRRLQLELCGFEPNSPAQLSSSSLCSQPAPCFPFVTRRPSLRDAADSPHSSTAALLPWNSEQTPQCSGVCGHFLGTQVNRAGLGLLLRSGCSGGLMFVSIMPKAMNRLIRSPRSFIRVMEQMRISTPRAGAWLIAVPWMQLALCSPLWKSKAQKPTIVQTLVCEQ